MEGTATITNIASAPGKVILLGEHAVVYGQPAIAAPLHDLRATVTVSEPCGEGITIAASNLSETFRLDRHYPGGDAEPLQATVRHTLEYLGLDPASLRLCIRICSDIPIARGLGSGTAVAAAIVRALAAYAGHLLDDAEVSELVLRTERLLHGQPSGVDNAVVVYERPIYFRRDAPPERLAVGAPFRLVIADTGVPARTRDTVSIVQRRWQLDRIGYERRFADIGALVVRARGALAAGDHRALGQLMCEDHAQLCGLGVSGETLDRLVSAALRAGALGAKLSGGGRGGVMVALAPAAQPHDRAADAADRAADAADRAADAADRLGAISRALIEAGAVQVLHTTLAATAEGV